MSESAPEVPLVGGIANQGLIVRVGDTVHRPQRPTSPATWALLDHLAEVGFDGAPRFLGVDAQGREVLTHVAGEAVTWPYPAWALTDDALRDVAGLLRRYHEAVADFDPGPYEWPDAVPEQFRGELVSHNDPNLDNVVFRDRRAAALIDFDLAGPGSRVWDVAAAARLWAPLRNEVDIHDARLGHSVDRLRTFVDAYGWAEVDWDRLTDAIRLSHDWVYEIVRTGGEQGVQGYADYWRTGGAERAERSRAWLAEAEPRLRAALQAPG